MSELRVVKKEYAGKPGFTAWLLRLIGSKASGPYDYTYSDGYKFRPYARGMSSYEFLAARGCTDPTGRKFQKYVDAAGLGKDKPVGHYVNWLELDR